MELERSLPTLMLPTNRGGGQASEALFGALYRELRGVARRELARLGPGASLGATSLLHEAYLDIADRKGMAFPDRARFFTYAARVMRGLIIDGLRRRQAGKRGGGFEITSLDGKDVDDAALSGDADEIERLGAALDSLAALEPEISGSKAARESSAAPSRSISSASPDRAASSTSLPSSEVISKPPPRLPAWRRRRPSMISPRMTRAA